MFDKLFKSLRDIFSSAVKGETEEKGRFRRGSSGSGARGHKMKNPRAENRVKPPGGGMRR